MEEVGGRKDILAVSIEYSSEPPMTYKLLINSYLSSVRKTIKDVEEPAPAAAARRARSDAAAAPPASGDSASPASDGIPEEEENEPADG